jgi:hypothetical protein
VCHESSIWSVDQISMAVAIRPIDVDYSDGTSRVDIVLASCASVTHPLLSSIVDVIDNYTDEARADARSNEDSKILNPSPPAEHARAVERLACTPGNISSCRPVSTRLAISSKIRSTSRYTLAITPRSRADGEVQLVGTGKQDQRRSTLIGYLSDVCPRAATRWVWCGIKPDEDRRCGRAGPALSGRPGCSRRDPGALTLQGSQTGSQRGANIRRHQATPGSDGR